MPGAKVRLLNCRAGAKVCGLPITSVVETMRPLPVAPLAGGPPFVEGVALIRGRPTPVLDLRTLLATERPAVAARYVTLRLGSPEAPRIVALAVDQVLGVREIAAYTLEELPGLLRAPATEVVGALGMLDAQLFVLLEHTRLLPEALWRELEAQERPT